MIRKILPSSDPRLRQISKPVGEIDRKILKLVQDLKDTLRIQKDPEGVGLAAPQIGKSLRVFLISYEGVEKVIINPKVLESKIKGQEPKVRRGNEIMEGCLSLPNFYGPLKRPDYVRIKYTNEKGEEKEEEFKGFFAQIILHEVDHLEGILFIDRLLSAQKPLYRLKGKEWEEVELI